MGSYCTLYFDDLDVCSSKSFVPDDFCAIFQEPDRRSRRSRDTDSESPEISYEAGREVVLARLDLLGCTSAVARERLEAWLKEERAEWNEYLEDGGDWAAESAQAIHDLTADEWYARISHVLATRYSAPEAADAVERHMREADGGWLWFDGYGSLIVLRALLDACADARTVKLDITDLAAGGWIDPNGALCQGRRRQEPLEPRPLVPTMVLGEGSSDVRILQHSLRVMYSEFQEYFSFFNHSDLSVDGGAGYLVKFLKAFAAARVPFRVVAIFDNDTAGIQAFNQAKALGLPDNFVIVRLPDNELARKYPTIGPQGSHIVDVNGQAASIELYLGRAALSVKSELRPVRWTGYNQTAQAYQGEVEFKHDVESKFFEQLTTYANSRDARRAFPELARVWETIFAEVRRSAESAERNRHRAILET